MSIRWDDSLPPKVQTEIERWDEWFEAVGLSKEWGVVKEQFPNDEAKQLTWAIILELNRLGSVGS